VNHNGVSVAAVYSDWLDPTLPSSWILVGSWKVPEHFFVGGDAISFYAANQIESVSLREALVAHSPCLPKSVKQFGYSTEEKTVCNLKSVPSGWGLVS
jgi:hypothetical protein